MLLQKQIENRQSITGARGVDQSVYIIELQVRGQAYSPLLAINTLAGLYILLFLFTLNNKLILFKNKTVFYRSHISQALACPYAAVSRPQDVSSSKTAEYLKDLATLYDGLAKILPLMY